MLTSTGAESFIPRVFHNEHQGHEIQKGDHARLSSFIGAIAVADLVKTTLGPKGMDKMMVSTGPHGGDPVITNDGATILKQIPVDNPAAKILVNISMTQDDEVGDGTTTVVVLAGELLREAEKLTLMMKLHPQTIIRGWRNALEYAKTALQSVAVDNRADEKKFRQDLVNVARTTLSSKIVTSELDFFAKLCVDAVLRLKGSIDLDMIQIIKKQGGTMRDSFLDSGFILDKNFGLSQKTVYKNPRIMIANTGMDTDKIKIWGARVKVHSMDEVAAIEKAEKEKMKRKVDKILAHNIDIFINRQLIYDYPEEIFRDAGVGSIEHADFEGVERLARVLDAEILSTFDKTEEKDESRAHKLGTCASVQEIMIGEDTVIKFDGVPKGEACTIVLRGASSHLLAEMERSIHDAVCILTQTIRDSKVVLGGGCTEMLMAQSVSAAALKQKGKEALAMDSFARALRQIPNILADNAGFDSAEIVTELRSEHAQGNHWMGVCMDTATVGDMRKYGVTESYKSKLQSLTSAVEAAEMILRVDDIVKCAPRARDTGRH
eukprot:CAMPEP_0202704838 /NCGR_PEP_ID=MMETSP1385-20130828/17458_1 /ASSEMBLY_ACC=CAM_ASM_000861 /TAXON_ID=933848 /ORGANISM="Elphidium margaritaceum" /LENGTH=547 /DNA_ID=CAMNT_0049362951 /DNA_START=128 /DNA_END=1771 /DNA_ORIENTATION=+